MKKTTPVAATVLVLALATSLALPTTSQAHDPMLPKILFHFRLGLGGDFEPVDESPMRRFAMEPGYGGGVELEVPLTMNFSLGGLFEAYAWTISSASGSYNVGFDLLFQPRARIPFGDHPGHYEVYFGFPIGPTVSVPSDEFGQATIAGPLDTGLGVTGGGRVGFRINADEIFGFYVDVGPMIQYVDYPSRLGGADFDGWHYQFVLRVGGSFGIPG